MTKSELIETLAKTEGLSLKMAERAVNIVFGSITQALAQGERVEIRGFGSFQVKYYDGYEGRNPRTGEIVLVKPKKLPKFKVGKTLRRQVDIKD